MVRITVSLAAFAAAALAPAAFAWGATGHELVSGCAIDGLSSNLPAFLRTKTARDQIALLGREPDRSKNAGKAHDYDRDPGHYINIGDDGLAAGTWSLDNLPVSRSDFESPIRTKGIKPPAPGYLPYSMIDGWQQVAKDFAIYRASKVAARNAKTAADRAWFAADVKLREQLIIRDIGVWSHYVGDASQPLHVTDHHDGWDKYTDPMTYPPAGAPPEIRGLHSFYEGYYVKKTITVADVRAAMTPYKDCACDITVRAPGFIKTTLSYVPALYDFVQSGALKDGKPEVKKFTVARIAAGASEVRDQIEDAWKASATMMVGYPNVNVADIESGKVILSRDSYGAD
jgi:hypothetical protein